MWAPILNAFFSEFQFCYCHGKNCPTEGEKEEKPHFPMKLSAALKIYISFTETCWKQLEKRQNPARVFKTFSISSLSVRRNWVPLSIKGTTSSSEREKVSSYQGRRRKNLRLRVMKICRLGAAVTAEKIWPCINYEPLI